MDRGDQTEEMRFGVGKARLSKKKRTVRSWRTSVDFRRTARCESLEARDLLVTAPLLPTASVANAGLTQLDLAWNSAFDPVSAIDHYRVYRNGSPIGTAANTSFSDSGVLPAESYVYEISAVTTLGEEGPRSVKLFVAKFQDGVSPTPAYSGTRDSWSDEDAPISVTGGTDASITIDGDVNSNNHDRNGYIKWDLSNVPASSVVRRAYLDLFVTNASNGPYNLDRLRRDWVENQTSWINYAAATPWQQPGGVGPEDHDSNLAASLTQAAANQHTLVTMGPAGIEAFQSWVDANDGVGGQPNHGFLIHNTANADGIVFTSREGAIANRPRLVLIYSEPTPPDPTPPTTPTGLTATPQGAQSVLLSWAPASDPETGVASYRILRNGVEIGGSNTTQFLDAGLLPGQSFEYQIVAVNGLDGASQPSAPLAYVLPINLFGRTLAMSSRDSYLPGIPVLVRLEIQLPSGLPDRSIWDAGATLSVDNPAVSLSTHEIRLYNGLGSALVTFAGNGPFTLSAKVGNQIVTRSFTSLAGLPQTIVSGTLPGLSTTWSGIVHVNGNVTVPAGHVLTVQPGTLVLVDGDPTPQSQSGALITVNGTINSVGTPEHPITFTATDPMSPWGGIVHNNAGASQYFYTDINRAGHSPDRGHTFTGPALLVLGSTVTLDHVNISDLAGKVGFSINSGGKNSVLTITNSLMTRAVMGFEIQNTGLLFEKNYIIDMLGKYREDGITDDDDGIYLHNQAAGQTITLRDSVIAHGDDDGIDTLDPTVTAENLIIREWANPLEDAKGISIFGGSFTLRKSLVVDSAIGVQMKPGSGANTVLIDRSTLVDNPVSFNLKEPTATPKSIISIVNSIVRGTNASISSNAGLSTISVNYSNTAEPWIGGIGGIGNSIDDPLFVDAPARNYHLTEGSPAVDTGNPAAPLDADGTRADMGALPLLRFVVTNVNNSGAGSLRSAITAVNEDPGTLHTIRFLIPGAGPKTIALASSLPTSIDPVAFELPLGAAITVGGAIGPGIGDFSSFAKLGPGKLSLGSSVPRSAVTQIDAAEGELELLSDFGSNTSVSSHALATFTAAQRMADLVIGPGGGVRLPAGGNRDLSVRSLSIDATAYLDLADHDLAVLAGANDASSAALAILNYLTNGFAAGNWNGPGIQSSVAQSDFSHLRALGWLRNRDGVGNPIYSDFSGIAVDANSVLVKHTYYGDANLDGRVDGVDYALIDNGFNFGLSQWRNGDVNYDSAIDGTDYAIVDNAFHFQSSPLSISALTPLADADAAAGRGGFVAAKTIRQAADEFLYGSGDESLFDPPLSLALVEQRRSSNADVAVFEKTDSPPRQSLVSFRRQDFPSATTETDLSERQVDRLMARLAKDSAMGKTSADDANDLIGDDALLIELAACGRRS